MTDRIRIEVPTRNTSSGGAGSPIVVSSYEVVNHHVTLARDDQPWTIGLEDIPELVAALDAVLQTHKAARPACYDCKRKRDSEGGA